MVLGPMRTGSKRTSYFGSLATTNLLQRQASRPLSRLAIEGGSGICGWQLSERGEARCEALGHFIESVKSVLGGVCCWPPATAKNSSHAGAAWEPTQVSKRTGRARF